MAIAEVRVAQIGGHGHCLVVVFDHEEGFRHVRMPPLTTWRDRLDR